MRKRFDKITDCGLVLEPMKLLEYRETSLKKIITLTCTDNEFVLLMRDFDAQAMILMSEVQVLINLFEKLQ